MARDGVIDGRDALQPAHAVFRIAELARRHIPEAHGECCAATIFPKLSQRLLRRVQFVAAQNLEWNKQISPNVPVHLRHSTGESVLTPPEIFLEFVQASDLGSRQGCGSGRVSR
ncbi:hypothetical protein [Methylorubrum sp. SB2]|uniref:hypothetical protein n=1 Tax=Methylorubrum subtropicum TaxID=3138812 RepID=UPI00313CCF98